MNFSILIPVYNFNLHSLVTALSQQLVQFSLNGEIIILDDASEESFRKVNKELEKLPVVQYFQNETNKGRMAARIKLSTLARSNYLLFLDADSGIVTEDFLVNYNNLIDKKIPFASGGRLYNNTAPIDCSYKLHWKYGSLRESLHNQQSCTKHKNFISNNFLIRKDLFAGLNQTETLTGYGHEDSWWGIQLLQAGIKNFTVNNPVIHLGLETAPAFIKKSEEALANLFLLEKIADKNLMARQIKIYRWFNFLRKQKLRSIFLFIEQPFHSYFYKNLISCNPRLLYFDLYRLAILSKMATQK